MSTVNSQEIIVCTCQEELVEWARFERMPDIMQPSLSWWCGMFGCNVCAVNNRVCK